MDQVLELVIAHGGAISGEHGDGRIRANLMRRFYGETLCEAFLAIKRLFDPEELLNPGDKVAERDPMGELRQTAEEPTEETFFHWAQGGPLAAAQECNGNGLCRRAEGGAMCPSYRALLDERHVTRGRAAALKLAMEGRLAGGEVDWNNPDVQETLSLCLSCKACRSECPSNVDVGKLKAEYTAQGFASGHGPTFATRAMANLGALARRASSLHPLPTWALAIPGVEAAVKACVGVASSRRLPRPVRSLSRGTHGADGPTVVLFPDCFASSFEPWIAEAAQRTLSAIGYRVVVPSGSWCCGRTALSCGVLKEARLSIERTASELFQAVKASDALAVIVLEPSCLSAIQEEWLELKTDLDPAVANELAERACSLEHFLLEHAGKHPHAVEPRSNDVLHVVHPHCHAKVVREELGLALRLLGVERVEVLDNGCCGMAGAFGYMKKTEPLSRTIAQQSLGPAMNGLEDAILVAPGTSCRHQVADCFGRRALHPAEVAALAIAPESVPSTT
jgi:Fe-S oxidoreductase